MAASRSSQETPGALAETRADEVVAPDLTDLMAQSTRARLLPAWREIARTPQSGGYLARIKGRGMEYDESRPYQSGDDIRALDWRVTARTGKPHTKLFREERERPVYLALDQRPAMFFGTRSAFKCVQAARAAALLAWKAQQLGDRVGGICFRAATPVELPPRRGAATVLRLLKMFVAVGQVQVNDAEMNASRAALTVATQHLTRVVRPGSLVFFLSDYRGLSEATLRHMSQLAQHNELLAIFIFDPFEQTLPVLAKPATVSDGTRSLRVSATDRELRERYAKRFAARLAGLRELARVRPIGLVQLRTDQDPLVVLQYALGARKL